jgi:hypothetical protein
MPARSVGGWPRRLSRGAAFHRDVLGILLDAGLPFLVGGAYALRHYTGVKRDTKDLDVFVHPADVERALAVLARSGYHTEMTFPHWLGKAFDGESFVDVIFSSGNGVAVVDAQWFQHAEIGDAFGLSVRVCPPEEMIWSKAFILERERYDGADVAHLLRATASRLDWDRLVRRFGRDWRVLFAHLVLFGFIYPTERDLVPERIMSRLVGRLESELGTPAPMETERPLCQGTLLSREQYLIDVEEWGYQDARLRPDVRMTPADIVHWTNSIPARSANRGEGERHPRGRR